MQSQMNVGSHQSLVVSSAFDRGIETFPVNIHELQLQHRVELLLKCCQIEMSCNKSACTWIVTKLTCHVRFEAEGFHVETH